MAHSQAEKPARVCDQWDGTLTDRNNQGGRGDETTRLAGIVLMGLNQTLSGRLAKDSRAATSSSANTVARLSLRGWLRCRASLWCWHRCWADGTRGRWSETATRDTGGGAMSGT